MSNFPYIHSTLSSNETLIYAAHPHRIIFSSAVLALLFALIIYHFGPQYLVLRTTIFNNYTLYQILAFFLMIIGLWWTLTTFINYRTSEYGVTTERILMKTGWIQRQSLELYLQKVEGIHIEQSVMGRLLDYGTVIIIGTGGTKDAFPFIPHPLSFRRFVQVQAEKVMKE